MRFALAGALLVVVALVADAQAPDWLLWPAAQAESIGTSTYAQGRVGKWSTMRLLKTERAISYKLAATWITPDVIHAAARLLQLRSRLTDDQARAAVSEAAAVRGTIVMVDIDPDEGSGIIPLEWEAFLQPADNPGRAVTGTQMPKLREVRTLAGVRRRNYDYDRFWISFPLTASDGQPIFHETDSKAELVVRIYEREGRVSWPIPPSVRARAHQISVP